MPDTPGKILFLSDINSAHTRKWVLSLADKGYQIGIFSLGISDSNWYKGRNNITCLTEGVGLNVKGKAEISKLKYVLTLPRLRKAIKAFNPDILHAHYATSYGLLGALSGFHPFIISVWGSDVFEFPQKSFFHKFILKRNLRNADRILSTSQAMAKETSKYTEKNISVTPFGIDLQRFKPQKAESFFEEGDIVIGTIKSLEPAYGVDLLIKAFDAVNRKHPELPLKLLIAGRGSEEEALKNLCAKLGIKDRVLFTGWIDPQKVPAYHNMIDIFAALSVAEESFGVSVIEASACGKPVVVSDAVGFKEVVKDGITGLIVPRRDSNAAAAAIEKLVLDASLRTKLGKAGREHVEKHYNWNDNLYTILNIYREILHGAN